MSTTSFVESKDFFGATRLKERGENWWEYQAFIHAHLKSKGIWDVIIVPATEQPALPTAPSLDADSAARAAYKINFENFSLYHKREGAASALLQATLNDTDRAIFLTSSSVYEGWKKLSDKYANPNSVAIQSKKTLLRKLECNSIEDLPAHLTRLTTLRNEISLAGSGVDDDDFVGAVLGGLPESIRAWKDGFTGAARAANINITPDSLMSALQELIDSRTPSSSAVSSFYSSPSSQPQSRSRRRPGGRTDLFCTNCKMTDHTFERCRAAGGGNEGGGTTRSQQSPAPPTTSTNASSSPAQPLASSSATSQRNPGSSLFASLATSAGGFYASSSVDGLADSATETDEFF